MWPALETLGQKSETKMAEGPNASGYVTKTDGK